MIQMQDEPLREKRAQHRVLGSRQTHRRVTFNAEPPNARRKWSKQKVGFAALDIHNQVGRIVLRDLVDEIENWHLDRRGSRIRGKA